MEIKEGFGLTETSGIISRNGGRSVGTKFGSVGRLINNTRAKVLDVETGESLAAGLEGELCVMGPQVLSAYEPLSQLQSDQTNRGHTILTGSHPVN